VAGLFALAAAPQSRCCHNFVADAITAFGDIGSTSFRQFGQTKESVIHSPPSDPF